MNQVLKVLGIIEAAAKAAGNMTVKEVADTILDGIEEKIKKTDNKLDDALIMPVINFVRFTANIEDNDIPEMEVEK